MFLSRDVVCSAPRRLRYLRCVYKSLARIRLFIGALNETTQFGGQRLDYRLQSAALGHEPPPTEIGNLNAVIRWL
jgi:hypothetical protein